MTAPIEILVEIVAQEADAAATPPLEEVLLRGSDRGKVFDNGKSYANFLVYDAQITQRANFFGLPGRRPESFLEVSYNEIFALHEEYNLAGKALLVRVGRGDSEADYNKPSTGSDLARCYVWRGFIPTDWVPTPSQDRSRCRLFLSEPLGYKSFPVLTDKVDKETYPTAPLWSLDELFPIPFGADPGRVPGQPLFPMMCVRVESGEADWALGNLPLARGGPHAAPFDQVNESPYNGDGTDYDNIDYAKAEYQGAKDLDGDYINSKRTLWSWASGIGATNDRPLPSVSNDRMLVGGGQVLYWFLRYKAHQSAASILDAYLYGTNAPAQLKEIDDISVCRLLNSALESSQVLERLANEFFVILRQVDGVRQSAGMEPKWTVADRGIKKPSLAQDGPFLLDVGWLVRENRGEPDIRELGAHPLYANSATLLFGRYPALEQHPSRTYYNKVLVENAADQIEHGIVEKSFTYDWNVIADWLLSDLENIEGLCSDRWGRWTKEDPVALYGFSVHLPMGDILVGDILDLGSIADGADGQRRYYFIEQTQLNWRTRQLVCLASRIRDRPKVEVSKQFNVDTRTTQQYDTRENYPPFLASIYQNPDTTVLDTVRINYSPWSQYGNYRFPSAFFYQVGSKLTANILRSFRVRFTLTASSGTFRLRMFMGSTQPPAPASPWAGWNSVQGATLLYDTGTTYLSPASVSFDYTLTEAQRNQLGGKYLWFTAERPGSGAVRSNCAVIFDVSYLAD